MQYDGFSFLKVSGANGVLNVRLCNPPVNLLDANLTRELNTLAKRLASDNFIKVLVVSSADPDFFLCHSDEVELLGLPQTEEVQSNQLGPFHKIMERFRLLPQITIGKIGGIARGGGLEFLLLLDMRFAAAGIAKFAFPEVAVGLIPGGGGTQRLPRLIGYSRSMYMLAGCEDIDALTAERWNLVDRAIPADELDDWVDKFAQRMASFPAPALRSAKEAAIASSLPLTQGLLEEERLFKALLRDPATRDRVEAFYQMGSQERQRQILNFEEMIRAI